MDSRRNLLASLLLVVFVSIPSAAQEERWKQLSAQVQQLYDQGRYAEAIPIAEESVQVAEAPFGPDDPRLAKSLSSLAECYRFQGRYAEAETTLKRALNIKEKSPGGGTSERWCGPE